MCKKNFYVVRGFFLDRCGFFYKKDSAAFWTFKPRSSSRDFRFIDPESRFAFRTYYNHRLPLLGSQSIIVARPMRNPPI